MGKVMVGKQRSLALFQAKKRKRSASMDEKVEEGKVEAEKNNEMEVAQLRFELQNVKNVLEDTQRNLKKEIDKGRESMASREVEKAEKEEKAKEVKKLSGLID